MMRFAPWLLLAACSAGEYPAPTKPPVPPAPVPIDAPTVPVADLWQSWIDAVATREPSRIEALLDVPLRVYYDDGVSGRPNPECLRWDRKYETATTAADRKQLSACIAATVVHDTGGDPIYPTGIVTHQELENVLTVPIQGTLSDLARDHVFVYGHAVLNGDFDFTLAVPQRGGRVDFVLLTAQPGC